MDKYKLIDNAVTLWKVGEILTLASEKEIENSTFKGHKLKSTQDYFADSDGLVQIVDRDQVERVDYDLHEWTKASIAPPASGIGAMIDKAMEEITTLKPGGVIPTIGEKTMDVTDEILDILGSRREATEEVTEAEPEVTTVTLTETDWEEREEGKFFKRTLFSKLFKKPTHVPDHEVVVFEGYPCAEVSSLYIPPWKEFEQLSLAFSLGLKTNVIGPTGCGKTMMMEYYASMTGRPYLRIQHNESFDKTEVFGQVHITEGDTDFVPGILPNSMSSPTLVLLDELTRNTGGSNIVYQELLDRGVLSLPELKDTSKSSIIPDEYWIVCASDNTKGNGEDLDKYPMSHVQDSAFINRWDMIIEQDYLTAAEEKKLVKALHPKMRSADLDGLTKFSALVHSGYKKGEISTAFSPRNLQAITKLMQAGVTCQQAIEMNYISRVAKSEKSDVAECLRAAFG